ncbi:MAG: hypothetical protein FWG40_00095 [Peptococcaceae bacterium]|nr:hypothetical protein [Peptococcaceae bacterium]
MEFSNELKDIVIVIIRRSWIALVCICLCSAVLFPVVPISYAEEIHRFESRVSEYKDILNRYVVLNTPLVLGFNSDFSEDGLVLMTSLEVHMQKYDTGKKILAKIEDRLAEPLDAYTLVRTYELSRAYGKSNYMNLKVSSTNMEDATLLRHALVEEIIETWEHLDPNTRNVVMMNVETLPVDNQANPVGFELSPPSYSSTLASVIAMAVIGGLLIGMLIIVIWNGLCPVLGNLESIEDKLGLRVYGEIKLNDRATHTIERLTQEYDFSSMNKITIISTNAKVKTAIIADWMKSEISRITNCDLTITPISNFLKNEDAIRSSMEADMIIIIERKFRSKINSVQAAINTLNSAQRKIDGLLLIKA